MTAEGTGYLMFNFHHAQVTFGQIVCKGHRWIKEKCQDLITVLVKTIQEISSFRLFDSSAFVRRASIGTVQTKSGL